MRKRNWHRERLSEVGETGWGFRHGTRSCDARAEPCRQGAGTEQKLELCKTPVCRDISVAQAALQRRTPRSHVQRWPS